MRVWALPAGSGAAAAWPCQCERALEGAHAGTLEALAARRSEHVVAGAAGRQVWALDTGALEAELDWVGGGGGSGGGQCAAPPCRRRVRGRRRSARRLNRGCPASLV